ncbi:tetratricopeptide repeat protein, partial [bacterium]|nr:tetratricopeptide repeat protein [bacterium]
MKSKILMGALIISSFMVLKVDSTFGDDHNSLAEEQYNYALSIEKDARQQKSIEGLQTAVREYKKVFQYPEAIEWVYKSSHNIEEIVGMLMEMGDYHKPDGYRFVLLLIEECQQTIHDYPVSNEAAIAEFAIGIIIRTDRYRYFSGNFDKAYDDPPFPEDFKAMYYDNPEKDVLPWVEVTRQFQKIADNYPDSKLVPHALMEVARSYDLTGYTVDDYPKAIAKYQEVIQDYPDTLYAVISQMCIGTEYAGVGYWTDEEASSYYKKAIEEIMKVITDMPNIKYWDSDTHTWAREKIKRILFNLAFPDPYAAFVPKVVFPATIQFQPDKWNIEWLKEHPGEGQINCYIGNIGTYTVEEIDTSWIRLNATVA